MKIYVKFMADDVKMKALVNAEVLKWSPDRIRNIMLLNVHVLSCDSDVSHDYYYNKIARASEYSACAA